VGPRDRVSRLIQSLGERCSALLRDCVAWAAVARGGEAGTSVCTLQIQG